jgi:hypothetical protein
VVLTAISQGRESWRAWWGLHKRNSLKPRVRGGRALLHWTRVLGWNISVYRLNDEEAIRDAFASAPAHPQRRLEFDGAALVERIAVWQAGVYGLDWIERIADEDGEGIALIRDGYPHWFLVRADDLIPQIVEGCRRNTWCGRHGERDACSPTGSARRRSTRRPMRSCKGEWLLVEAWDQS